MSDDPLVQVHFTPELNEPVMIVAMDGWIDAGAGAANAMSALLSTIGSGLATAMKDEGEREAALVTFVVTASGLVWLGIASAFWGVVAGVIVRAALRR